MTKRPLGELIAILLKSQRKTQSQIVQVLGWPHCQLNRFLNGHGDLSCSNFVSLLKELGIDIEKQLQAKLKKHTDIDDASIETTADCVQYILQDLDSVSRQTLLRTFAWASDLGSRRKMPSKVSEILKRETNSI